MESKNSAAVELGKLGARVRAKRLTSKQRSEIAKSAARARWSFRKKGVKLRRVSFVIANPPYDAHAAAAQRAGISLSEHIRRILEKE
jgi:hypothetical protein